LSAPLSNACTTLKPKCGVWKSDGGKFQRRDFRKIRRAANRIRTDDPGPVLHTHGASQKQLFSVLGFAERNLEYADLELFPGGQKKQVSEWRVCSCRIQTFCCSDEPTNHLNVRRGRVAGKLCRITKRRSRHQPTTVIFSDHCRRIVEINLKRQSHLRDHKGESAARFSRLTPKKERSADSSNAV